MTLFSSVPQQRSNIPCHLQDISCGLTCNKTLPCENHRCRRICHRGECLADGSCQQPCVLPRPDCGHPCSAPCHPGSSCPRTTCTAKVRHTESSWTSRCSDTGYRVCAVCYIQAWSHDEFIHHLVFLPNKITLLLWCKMFLVNKCVTSPYYWSLHSTVQLCIPAAHLLPALDEICCNSVQLSWNS